MLRALVGAALLVLSVTSALSLRAPAGGPVLSSCLKPWKGCPEGGSLSGFSEAMAMDQDGGTSDKSGSTCAPHGENGLDRAAPKALATSPAATALRQLYKDYGTDGFDSETTKGILQPTTAPSPAPTPRPTHPPPTPGPLPAPTSCPTPTPTTPGPSPAPTPRPTSAPTTPNPSPAPTPRPTSAPTTPNPSPAPTPAPTPAKTMVKVASSVTLEGIVATEFNADEGLKAAFAQSILDSAGGAFDEVIDVEAAGRRRRLDDGSGVGVSYTGVARVDGTDDAASVGAGLLEQASDALTAALGDGSFLTNLQAADTAFAVVTVDVAATQAAIADAALEVIVTTPSPSASPTPRPTVAPTAAQTAAQTVAQTAAPTATPGSDTVDAAHRLSGVSAALLVLALAA